VNRIDAFLELAVNQRGSDLHLVAGQPPRIRIDGELQPVRFRELAPGDITALLDEFMTSEQRQALEAHHSVDFAYQTETCGRFRVNAYRSLGGIAAALRAIPAKVPSLESLSLPGALQQVLSMSNGLVLVTGPTGSGKSTTLAAMVDYLNENRRGHVITIEDPIEFVHENRRCVITQREIGAHAPTFAEALRSVVREDPDAILVGEMRDLETIALALTAAETGILVLGTLHTNGAVRCVDRIVNVFPPRRQDQVRTVLADCLRLVVSQQLVRRADQAGRLVAAEIMINTHAISAMIRRGDTHKMTSAIQAGGRLGMQGLDAVLTDYLRRGIITAEEAYDHAIDRAQFANQVSPETLE
jgi:twitching motility protein PilT